ncbi:DUF485 domain-containing protein [Streptantibioticus ferralitis]|uniref:DUF485 domain-containing protein n=1 Tax=Streptantibioticus ferralitis TaxID=236510 RepID=A0ABT5Z5I5_9ACTN|nr:DUF485 domain-containing protein [Streptantibioticus ferralitis]MDF2259088.1 DUF485 domain-containing protein [Streptantibioticus ferralitis]
MDEHDGGRAVRLGVEDPWTDALAVGPWEEPVAAPAPTPSPGPRPGPQPAPRAYPPLMPPALGGVEPGVRGGPLPQPGAGAAGRMERDRSAVYREVQAGEAFQEVRRRYRRFAFPAAGASLVWYLLYVVAAITAPGLMARPVAGAVNVAMAAGLAQFVTTFLLTWAYARHARLHRDRAALDLRWDTQERVR